MVIDNEVVVVAAGSSQIFSLQDLEVAESLVMRKGLKFAKEMSFLNLIAESDALNVVLALNVRQQSPTYVGYKIGDCISFNGLKVVNEVCGGRVYRNDRKLPATGVHCRYSDLASGC
ncbi:hypothetical protein MTR_4g028270 [Medicago truncatula]|uniref:Uncharacterized protein n=1 Tax=Medicago truncatula TaxID=3880 RepID=G7JIC3_MEDTR|nr:hypothetical protein MTR_4g028270 [Medicago truncatula]